MKSKIISILILLAISAVTASAVYISWPDYYFRQLQNLSENFGKKSVNNGMYADIFQYYPVTQAYFQGRADAFAEAQADVNSLIYPTVHVSPPVDQINQY